MKKYLTLFMVLTIIAGASSVFAEANLGLNAVGGRIGFIMPEDPIDNTLGFGLHADLGTLMPNLTLHGYLDYWSKGYDDNMFGTSTDLTFSVLGIAAIAKYHFEMDGNIKPYAGGGLGLDIGSASFEYTEPFTGTKVDESSSDTDLAVHLIGGAAMELSPKMDGFAEVKYTIGGADSFGIYVGVSYKLK